MDGLAIPTLETERLRLRPFRASDFDDYAAMCGDPEVARHLLSGVPLGRDVAWRHLAFLVGHWQLRGCGMWAVEERATGTFVGRIGFAHPDGWPGFELAWTLVRHRWGRGYATEGARAALAHAFTALDEDRVISLIQPVNHASIRVAERLGETLQGRTELLGKEYLVYGIDRDSYAGTLELTAPRALTNRAPGAPGAPGRGCPTRRSATVPTAHEPSARAVRRGLRADPLLPHPPDGALVPERRPRGPLRCGGPAG